MKTALILALGLAAAPMTALAAQPWTLQAALGAPPAFKLSGSVRLRYEALDGHVRPGARATQGLTSLRSILSAEYDLGGTRLGADLYDSRVYGGHADGVVTNTEVNTFEPVQVYAAHDFVGALGPGTRVTATLGRTMLNLGSRRLVAADDYRNTTNSYGGLRVDAHLAHGGSATLIYVAPTQRRPDDLASVLDNDQAPDRESRDLILWGGIAATAPARNGIVGEAAFYDLKERDHGRQATRDRDLHTVSLRLLRAPRPGRWDFDGEVMRQFGTISADLTPTARRLDVSASFVHVDLGYQFAGPWKPHLRAEYDRGSGDDGRKSYGRFDTLFGMRRAEFGPSGVYAAIGRPNLNSPGLRLEATPSARLDAYLVYRGLWLASATDAFATTGVRDPSGRSGHFAGRQLESRVRYWLEPGQLRLELNGVWLDKAGVLKTAPNAPRTGDTLYLAVAAIANF